MKIIGVTGISGSGTSTAAEMLAEIGGGFVITADKLSHDAMANRTVFSEIVRYFGNGIVNRDGAIIRARLGDMVFGQPKRLALLQSIIHPHVRTETERLLAYARQKEYPLAIIDAPLLIEAEMHKMCDITILITATNRYRIDRIMERDGISLELAHRRLESRDSDEALREHVQMVIINNYDLGYLRIQLEDFMKKFMKEEA